MSLNHAQRAHNATRSLVAPKLLVLLGRAKGLDILRWDEQSTYGIHIVDMKDRAAVTAAFANGDELVSFKEDGSHAEFKRLLHINYPIAGYTGYDMS